MKSKYYGQVQLFNLAISTEGLDSAVETIVSQASRRPASFVVTMNADHVVKLATTRSFQVAYRRAQCVFADGMPIYWMTLLRGAQRCGRVAGSDLLPRVLKRCEDEGISTYFVGGDPARISSMRQRIRSLYPRLIVLGCEAPIIPPDASRDSILRTAERVVAQKPQLIVAALGAPKQELWASTVVQNLTAGCILPVGAALDFMLGEKRRAPILLQLAGLEWVYRLAHEPRRLARRYIVGNLVFLRICWRTRLGRRAIAMDGEG